MHGVLNLTQKCFQNRSWLDLPRLTREETLQNEIILNTPGMKNYNNKEPAGNDCIRVNQEVKYTVFFQTQKYYIIHIDNNHRTEK